MQSKTQIAKIIGAELEAAISNSSAADNGTRKLALLYYSGAMPVNDDKNGDPNREAVSLDVADMVEAVYAQMAPALEDSGGVEFEAVSADDEPQAMKETAIVRAMLMEGNNGAGGWIALTEAIKDALLMRTGSLGLSVERRETRTPERWEDVPGTAVGEVSAPNAEDQSIEALSIEPVDDFDDANPLFDVSFKRVDVTKRLAMASIAPENFVTSALEDRDPNQVRFCADRMVTTRAALVAAGFSEQQVSSLTKHNPESYENYIDRTGLNGPGGANGGGVGSFNLSGDDQKATEIVEVWRCYCLIGDTASSARGERYRVYYSRADQVVIGEPEQVGRVCYALGNVIIMPHRLAGVSLFDKLGEVQELKTKALRSWVENLHKVNRPRLAVDDALVSMADVMDATLDVVRTKGANAILPIPTIDAGPSVSAFLQYQDNARSERGGASLDMQGANIQIAGNQSAQGIERQYSVKEQLAATMARTFAETCLRSAYQIAHYLLRTAWGGPIRAKVGGQWVEEDPSQWRVRTGVVVRVGQSHTERQRKGMGLQQVMAMQAQMMGSGKSGILTDDQKLFNAATDWIASLQLRAPDRYLIDPTSPEAQKAAQGQAAQQKATALAQGQAAHAALALEKYKIDVQALTSTLSDMVKAAIEEAKLTLSTAPLDQVQALGNAQIAQSASGMAESEQAGQGGEPGQDDDAPAMGL